MSDNRIAAWGHYSSSSASNGATRAVADALRPLARGGVIEALQRLTCTVHAQPPSLSGSFDAGNTVSTELWGPFVCILLDRLS